MAPGAQSPSTTLLTMIGGFRVTQAIYVAAKLELADRLGDGPRAVGELAEAVGAHAGALGRLLRALASIGIVAEEEGRFALTPMGQLLRHGVPGSLHGQAVLMGEPFVWQVTGELLHSVRTGEPAHAKVFGVDIWRYLADHRDAHAIFDAAMTSLSALETDAVLAAYDFSPAKMVVDIGGGQGALLAAILRAQPNARGILFEQSPVADGARKLLAETGLGERCQVVAGDMFRDVPEGGDLYILKRVLHDWNDEKSAAILRSCAAAMRPGARLLLAEPMIPAGNTPHPAKLLDLQMLVSQGGRERTADEFRTLLASAGFDQTSLAATSFLLTIVEATRR